MPSFYYVFYANSQWREQMNFKDKLRANMCVTAPTVIVAAETIELSMLQEEIELQQADAMLEYGLDQLDNAIMFSELTNSDMLDDVTDIVMAGGKLSAAKEGLTSFLKAIRDFFMKMVNAAKEFFKKHFSQVGRYKKKIHAADDSNYDVSGEPKKDEVKVSLSYLPMGSSLFDIKIDSPALKLFLKSIKALKLDKASTEVLKFNLATRLWLKDKGTIKDVQDALDEVHKEIATIFLMGDFGDKPKAIKGRDDVLVWMPGLPNLYIEMTEPGNDKGIKWGYAKTYLQPAKVQSVLNPATIKQMRNVSKESIDVAYDFSKDSVAVAASLEKMGETFDELLKKNAAGAIENIKDAKLVVKRIRELTGLVNFLTKNVGKALTAISVEAHNYATVSAKQYSKD